MQADCATFTQGKGLGNAKYAQLQAVLEMARRHTFEELDRGDVLTSPGPRGIFKQSVKALSA